MTTDEETRAVLKHHFDSFMALDFPAVLSDYTDDSVLMMPTGTLRGVGEIQEGMGQSGGKVPLPTPDVIDEVGFSATSAKVALVSGLDLLSGAAPGDPRIIDFVGYGTATFAEGTPAPKLSNTTAAVRAGGGCVDTNDNGLDFTELDPTPRNTSSPLVPCN